MTAMDTPLMRLARHIHDRYGDPLLSEPGDDVRIYRTASMTLCCRGFGAEDRTDPVTVPIETAAATLSSTPSEIVDVALSDKITDPDNPGVVLVTDGWRLHVQRSWLDAVADE
jgi:hypothetical protein